MSTKSEAALLEQDDPKEKSTVHILPQFEAAVKDNDLKKVLGMADLQSKGAVKLLRERFPSFDKTTLAKCCKPEKYGCVLHPDGYTLLRDLIPSAGSTQEPQEAGGTAKRKKRDCHKLTCRIYCRLTDNKWLRLRRAIQADGYRTMQDWMSAQVDAYLSGKEE